jgi:hypothetical protein
MHVYVPPDSVINFNNKNRQVHNSKMPSKLKSTVDLRAYVFWDGTPCGLVYSYCCTHPLTDKPPLNLS